MNTQGHSAFVHLSCPVCGKQYDARRMCTYCQSCESPLIAVYDVDSVRTTLTPQEIRYRQAGIWRWSELLPVFDRSMRVYLGEGDTPLLRSSTLGQYLGLPNLYIKDESANPTASFKARGLAMAVSKGKELGIREFVIPTAGNAGGALAAYAARAGVQAHIYMPADAPAVNQMEVKLTGADLHLVDGLITDAARKAKADAAQNGWFDVSTFKEPYRLEGKKNDGV